MTNIHIGNLSYGTTEEGLRAAFEQFGKVESARIIIDRNSGRSKGFGFVEMTEDEQAAKAIEELNGKPIDGRIVRVSKAIPWEEREKGNRGNNQKW